METLTISKKAIQEILDKFPDKIIVQDFIEHVTIIAKIETAREQFKNGEYLTEKELDEEIKKWR
ncbi:MAG: hypothetical protein ACHQIM_08770 [Sphingobacteriales bacterium]